MGFETMMNPNSTVDSCPETDPSSTEVWEVVVSDSRLKGGFITMTIMAILLLCSFTEAFVYNARKIPHGEKATSLIWICGMFPIFAATSLLGLYFPRAIVLCNLTASLYFSVSIYQAWLLFMFYFGDEGMAYTCMAGQDVRIFSCFSKPKVTIGKKTFRWLKAGILQAATLQPVILFVEDILWLNGTYHSSKLVWNDAFLYLNALSLISSTIALIALVITYKASKIHLKTQFYITPKFTIVILALIFANMQIILLHILTFSGAIPCNPPFKSQQRAHRYQCLILLIESFCIQPFVLMYFRTRKGNMVGVLETRETSFKYDVLSNGYIRTKQKYPRRDFSGPVHFNTYTSI
ncbi:Organic solute transporter subunit alpha [Holothuria leucospilota]|uniref:Organic solute transporter subunit alpha n=1 Tax=Holothuria leucospilota TaxID=206669 RepID=A0A9Q1CB64_HOLLE|nr:Organic solute transporter subunit alpha [Holothuria leucospilota]